MNIDLLKENEYVFCENKDDFLIALNIFRLSGVKWQVINKEIDRTDIKYFDMATDCCLGIDKNGGLFYTNKSSLINQGYRIMSFLEFLCLVRPKNENPLKILNENENIHCQNDDEFIQAINLLEGHGYSWKKGHVDELELERLWKHFEKKTIVGNDKNLYYGARDYFKENFIYSFETFKGLVRHNVKLEYETGLKFENGTPYMDYRVAI